MSDDLIFYTNPMSRGRIVRWMLEELGEPYQTQIMDYATTLKSPEYLAVNPMGKVPAISHGGVVVTEAAAICAYPADAFPAKGLRRRWAMPPGPLSLALLRLPARSSRPPASVRSASRSRRIRSG